MDFRTLEDIHRDIRKERINLAAALVSVKDHVHRIVDLRIEAADWQWDSWRVRVRMWLTNKAIAVIGKI